MTTVTTTYDNINDNPTMDVQNKKSSWYKSIANSICRSYIRNGKMHDLVASYFMESNLPLIDEIALSKQILNIDTH